MHNLVSVSGSGFVKASYNTVGNKMRVNDKVYNSLLECVGNTPIVKLNRIPKKYGVSCDIFVKCEFMNPAGSAKDRIAEAMAKDAKAAGAIKEDSEFLEFTSGNTGIGIAFNAAILGKKCTIVMGDKNSAEKVNIMRLMGTEVLKLHDNVKETARQIKDNNPDKVVMFNQYINQANQRIHYETTGAEILATMGTVDMVVAGAGTGGTISGIGLRVKENLPNCLVVAGEPDGSNMFNKNAKTHPFLIEGVGGDPSELMVLDKSVVDHFETVTDQEAFIMSRDLAKNEGILCGGSSGMAVAAAVKAIKTLNIGAGKRVVVLLPDGIINYMTKFVSDQWMEAHLFIDPPLHTMRWWQHPITNLVISNNKYPLISNSFTCEQALYIMKAANIAVIVDNSGYYVGAISKDSLRGFATNPPKLPNVKSEEFDFTVSVTEHLAKDIYTLAENSKKGTPTVGLLSRILDISPFVVIGEEGHDTRTDSDYLIPKGIVTGEDVLDYIFSQRIGY